MTRKQPSGRFVIRMEPRQHQQLRAAAETAGLSLNEYCVRVLARPVAEGWEAGFAAINHARAVLEDRLTGVVLFGSWARGEAVDGSDVDLLIVVNAELGITRDLYGRWDEGPPSWDGRKVEPHFVHLAEVDGRMTGLWAEMAVEGIVLFDRGFMVSRRLARLRGKIAEGAMVRRSVQGQSYWVAA